MEAVSGLFSDNILMKIDAFFTGVGIMALNDIYYCIMAVMTIYKQRVHTPNEAAIL